MKIKRKAEFTPCPDYEGEAVCVDITPLEQRHYENGTKDVFQIASEVDLKRDDVPEGQSPRYVVWSSFMTPLLVKRASLYKFICAWFGRPLTEEELDDFDTEELLGKPAMIWVEQKTSEDKTFSNIVMIRPSKKPIKPTGKFVRKQDRESRDDKGGGGGGGGDRRGASFKGTTGGKEERKPDRVPTEDEIADDPGIVRVHIGPNKGHELRDLDREDIETIIESWLEGELLEQEEVSAADRRLRQALRIFKKRFARSNEEAKAAKPAKSRRSDNDGGDGEE